MAHSILIMFHCNQHTGYAIGSLEEVFKRAAIEAGFDQHNILWSYRKVFSPEVNVFAINYVCPDDTKKLKKVLKEHKVSTILAFDLRHPSPIIRTARKMGTTRVVAYWGASMSSLYQGFKLILRRCQWILQAHAAPDFFIFESDAMRKTGTHGRGIPSRRTCVIPLGVDTNIFFPAVAERYAQKLFSIPINRKIIIYSGHMEERKGLRVLMDAMLELERRNRLEPVHLLICGNKEHQSKPYEDMLSNSEAKNHVTFAGYRTDVPQLMRSAYLGTIASTGWDSFTMSSVEMLSSGLPLIVSELQGLKETIENGVCGFYIAPGDYHALASLWLQYIDDIELRERHSKASRERAERLYSIDAQVTRIARTLTPKPVFPNEIFRDRELEEHQ
ncbi:glycosyltransferase family 4 protein [Marinobacter adhaerens]|uniref:glycosyltransferase family 4 protein n=1 Tax=Marinobacter adhaerens TaxID=1033846 RepID=UPI001C581EF2|nr:glycosyltransferase family 4 protein [Marinobacter adhaerens]MBW3225619.1 glycosyltransferase family 4 protein [Marinobacter adhaerens]